MKKTSGILVCLFIVIPIFTTVVNADPEPEVEIEITGGFRFQCTITNTGEVPLFDIIWCEIKGKISKICCSGSPGMSEPLNPGESLSFIYPHVRSFTKMPFVRYCTYTVTVYENGGDNTIYAEKSVNALTFLSFVKIISQ